MVTTYLSNVLPSESIGGAEFADGALISFLREQGHVVNECKFDNLAPDKLAAIDSPILVSDFFEASADIIDVLYSKQYYLIEHDWKFHPTKMMDQLARDGRLAVDNDNLINYKVYENARCTFVQSQFQKLIFQLNLGNFGKIVSLQNNCWSKDTVNKLRELAGKYPADKKTDKVSIMAGRDSNHAFIKGTVEAISLCEQQKWDYEIIPPLGYHEFLERLARNEKFLFLPNWPESFSRTVVEALAMGVKPILEQNYPLIGATFTAYPHLSQEQILDKMEKSCEDIAKIILQEITE